MNWWKNTHLTKNSGHKLKIASKLLYHDEKSMKGVQRLTTFVQKLAFWKNISLAYTIIL